jgi:hypothetical protein
VCMWVCGCVCVCVCMFVCVCVCARARARLCACVCACGMCAHVYACVFDCGAMHAIDMYVCVRVCVWGTACVVQCSSVCCARVPGLALNASRPGMGGMFGLLCERCDAMVS